MRTKASQPPPKGATLIEAFAELRRAPLPRQRTPPLIYPGAGSPPPAISEAASPAGTLQESATARVANRLLACLPPAEYRRVLLDSEPLSLLSSQVLHEAGQPIRHVYFPVNAVLCLLAGVGPSRNVGIGLVGREGMVGIPLVLGQKDSDVRALVHTPGTALRMSAERFQSALRECPMLRQEMHRHAYEKLVLARQAIACNRFHSTQQRLACWLLMTRDRLGSGELPLTQAFLAKMLAVRRGTINEIAVPLQQQGLITYTRGTLWVLDPKGLEKIACRCYTKIDS